MMIEQKSILVHSVGGFTEVWTTVTVKKMKMKVKGLEEEEMGKKKEVHVFHVQTITAKCEVKEEDGQLTHKNLQWEKKEEDVAETVFCQEDASSRLTLSEVKYSPYAGTGGLPCLMEGPSGKCFESCDCGLVLTGLPEDRTEISDRNPAPEVPAEVPCVLLSGPTDDRTEFSGRKSVPVAPPTLTPCPSNRTEDASDWTSPSDTEGSTQDGGEGNSPHSKKSCDEEDHPATPPSWATFPSWMFRSVTTRAAAATQKAGWRLLLLLSYGLVTTATS